MSYRFAGSRYYTTCTYRRVSRAIPSIKFKRIMTFVPLAVDKYLRKCRSYVLCIKFEVDCSTTAFWAFFFLDYDNSNVKREPTGDMSTELSSVKYVP